MASIPKKLLLELNLPDEVLIEILLRLPLLSLQLFRSVSKHWLSLITSEYFTRRLRKPRIDIPCGLFTLTRDSEVYDFLSLGPKVTSFLLRAIITDAGNYFRIIQSCNGLLLCSNYVSSRVNYYVYNPFTNLFKNIPFAQELGCTDMILAFDPTKSPYYKVVITGKKVLDWHWGEDWKQYWEHDHWEEESEEDRGEDEEEDIDTEEILIYSSETGRWRICGPPFQEDWFRGFAGGIYWNNAIHWIRSVDDGLPLHSKFDIVDHPIITNIQTPTLDNMVNMSLFESRGSLLLLMKDFHCCYQVFEMKEESSEWSVKYIIDDTVNIVPDLYWHTCGISCIVLGQREDDSFMVIQLDNKIVRYNFVSKTVSKICSFMESGCLIFDCVPFIASLAGV